MRKDETVDTNVLLRLILHDNNDYYKRAASLISSPRHYFFVLDQAIIECIYVLENGDSKLSRSEIAEVMFGLFVEPRLDYNEELFDKVFAEYLRRPKLSFTDCYMAFKSEELERTPLYTFDEKLARQNKNAKLVPALSR